MGYERRGFTSAVGAAGGARKTIYGYAAVYGKLSEDLGGFREMIRAGAFDGVLGQDTVGLFNHDSNLVLGRTTSGSLRLAVNSAGLAYEIDPPPTTWAGDLLVSIARGDVHQSSFAFTIARGGDEWREATPDTPYVLRIINRVERLYDVSPVTSPAYEDTSATVLDWAQRLIARGGAVGANAMAEVARRHAHRRRQLQLADAGG
jgi:uncharacterized protein